jgi:hypothetical protein
VAECPPEYPINEALRRLKFELSVDCNARLLEPSPSAIASPMVGDNEHEIFAIRLVGFKSRGYKGSTRLDGEG